MTAAIRANVRDTALKRPESISGYDNEMLFDIGPNDSEPASAYDMRKEFGGDFSLNQSLYSVR